MGEAANQVRRERHRVSRTLDSIKSAGRIGLVSFSVGLVTSSALRSASEDLTARHSEASVVGDNARITSSQPADERTYYKANVTADGSAEISSGEGLLKMGQRCEAKSVPFIVEIYTGKGDRQLSIDPNKTLPASDEYVEPKPGEEDERAIVASVPNIRFKTSVAPGLEEGQRFNCTDLTVASLASSGIDDIKKRFADGAGMVDQRFQGYVSGNDARLSVGSTIATAAAGTRAERCAASFSREPRVVEEIKQSLAEQVVGDYNAYNPDGPPKTVADVVIKFGENDEALKKPLEDRDGTFASLVKETRKSPEVVVSKKDDGSPKDVVHANITDAAGPEDRCSDNPEILKRVGVEQ